MERPSSLAHQQDDLLSALENLENEVCSLYAHIDSLVNAADNGSEYSRAQSTGAWLAYQRLWQACEKVRVLYKEEE